LFCDILVIAAAVYVVVDAPAVVHLLQFVSFIVVTADTDHDAVTVLFLPFVF